MAAMMKTIENNQDEIRKAHIAKIVKLKIKKKHGLQK